MKKYIVLCDHNVPWCKNVEQMLRTYKIEVVYIEMLKEAIDKIKDDMCCLLVCSEYEFDEYCKAYDIKSHSSIYKIIKSPVNTAIISDSANETREIEFFDRGAVEYQWRGANIDVIIRRLIVAAGLNNQLCARNHDMINEIINSLDRSLFTRKEIGVLEVIASYKGGIASKEIIISKIWGKGYKDGSRALDTIVKKIRKKTKKYGLKIENKYGEGYYIDL